jgi:hypothetical protein
LFSLEPQPPPRSHNARLDTTHSSAALGLAMERVKTACGNILECFWRQSWEKGRPVTRQSYVLLLLWRLCEYPAPLSPTHRYVRGGCQNLPWLAITTPNFCFTPTSKCRSGFPPSQTSAPTLKGREWGCKRTSLCSIKTAQPLANMQKGKSSAGIGAQGQGQPYVPPGFSGIFSPVINCSRTPPPFATIAAPHSFIDPGDPSRPDDARG